MASSTWILLGTTLFAAIYQTSGLECYSCENMPPFEGCRTTIQCLGRLQTCESRFVITSNGQTRVTKRCVDADTCPPLSVNECNSQGNRCRYCCTGDLCNRELTYFLAPGPSMIKGERGDQGLPGLHGLDGRPGYDGLNGWKGEPGYGPDGVDGLPGMRGQKGNRGMVGLPGLDGENGPCIKPTKKSAPKRVAFSVQSSNVINDRQWTILPVQNVITNIGGAFNGTDGKAVFTAPVAGIYRFLVNSIANGDEAVPVVLFHNETKVGQTAHHDKSRESPLGTVDVILTMEVGDKLTAKLRLKQSWSILDNGYSAYSDVTFSGYLIKSLEEDSNCPKTTPAPPTTEATTSHPTTTPGTATMLPLGYDCSQNSNPCTPENLATGKYYYPHVDPHKFCQCDTSGRCFAMPCAPGTVWNDAIMTCTRS